MFGRWSGHCPRKSPQNPSGIVASNDKPLSRLRTTWNDPEIMAVGEQPASASPEERRVPQLQCPRDNFPALRCVDPNMDSTYVKIAAELGAAGHRQG